MGSEVSLRGQESKIEFRSKVFGVSVHVSRPGANNWKGEGDLLQPALEDLESADMWTEELRQGEARVQTGGRQPRQRSAGANEGPVGRL